jgi:hypothetical protein
MQTDKAMIGESHKFIIKIKRCCKKASFFIYTEPSLKLKIIERR